VKVGSCQTRPDGGRRVCVTCGTEIGGYQYRFHPSESDLFERCVGLTWCPGCRIYSATMVYVPRAEVLIDAVAKLPSDQQERLRNSELELVDYLAGRGIGED
jgi:hypothetical protein